MKITKKTVPYSIFKCTWDKEAESWLFKWGEEIPDSWVAFSIKHEFPVESINKVFEEHPTEFELDEDVLNSILEDDD